MTGVSMDRTFLALCAILLGLTLPAASAGECNPEFQTIREHLQPGAILLVGEVHGTREMPAAFGDLACHAVADGHEVLIGLEMTSDQQAGVDAYLGSEGDDAAREALLKHSHWATRDGRSSGAMLALLERVRLLKQSGKNVTVFMFDSQAEKTSQARDRTMAELAAKALRRQGDAVALLLSGNIHTLTTKSVPWDAGYEPMGLHLKREFPQAISVLAAHSGGQAWICQPDKCGEFEMPGKPANATRGIRPAPEREHLKADLVLAVGPITSSTPAAQ